MSDQITFRTTIELGAKIATGFAVPDDVVASLGAGRRHAVRVTVGQHSYRTTIASMGGRFTIPLSADNRAAAGVAAEDDVEVQLEAATAPREVALPADLADALAHDELARTFFQALAYTHRKDWLRWIEDAKKPQTRTSRLAATIDALHAGKRTR